MRQVGARVDLAFALHRLAYVVAGCVEGIAYADESVAIYRELDDLWGMGQALYVGAFAYSECGIQQGSEEALQQAQRYAQECLAVYQQLDSPYGIALAFLILDATAYWLADYSQAWIYSQKAHIVFEELGIHWGEVYSLQSQARSACALGEYTHARQYVLQGLQWEREYAFGNARIYLPVHLLIVAESWLGEGKVEQAYELLGLVDRWREKAGFTRSVLELRSLSRLDEELPPTLAAAVERGRARDFDAVVKEVMRELECVEDAIPQSTSPKLPAEPLTARESEILHLMADGLNSREIAQQLVLSVGTIRWYLKHIYSKLDVHSRSQAIARARALNLLV